MAARQNFVGLAVKGIALQHKLIVQEKIVVAAIFVVGVDIEDRTEFVELVCRVQGKQRAPAFFAHAAISLSACADVQIFLHQVIIGDENDFVVAVAFAARRNYF